MKKLIVLAIGLATALPFAIAQNNTLELDLEHFENIELGVNAQLEISEGSQQSVSISGPQDLITEITTEVFNETWKIKYPDYLKRQQQPELTIKVVVTSLEGLGVSGNGSITGKGKFSKVPKRNFAVSGTGSIEFKGDADFTMIALSGSGYMNIETNGDEIHSVLSGSGNIDLNGTTEDLRMITSGSGNMGGRNLKTNTCKVVISGSSVATAHVVKSADITVSGSGYLAYKGNPRISKKQSSGSSCVKKIGK